MTGAKRKSLRGFPPCGIKEIRLRRVLTSPCFADFPNLSPNEATERSEEVPLGMSGVRFLLELWYNGDLTIDLECVNTVKNLKNIKIGFNGVASVKPLSVVWYKKTEYWDKNPARNIYLMTIGLRCRVHSLIL